MMGEKFQNVEEKYTQGCVPAQGLAHGAHEIVASSDRALVPQPPQPLVPPPPPTTTTGVVVCAGGWLLNTKYCDYFLNTFTLTKCPEDAAVNEIIGESTDYCFDTTLDIEFVSFATDKKFNAIVFGILDVLTINLPLCNTVSVDGMDYDFDTISCEE